MDMQIYGSASSAAAASYKALELKEEPGGANAQEQEAEKGTTQRQSESYKPDMEKINRMKADMSSNITAFKQMVFSLIKKQGTTFEQVFGGKVTLEIDEATQKEAQAAIADDGYWGVEQTANRILEFAKSLADGDSALAEGLRDAVKAGFDAAEKVWGGKLPEISYKTYDRVMKGFDDWANASAAQDSAE